MRQIKWKNTPHEKIFWGAVIVMAIVFILFFAKRVVGF